MPDVEDYSEKEHSIPASKFNAVNEKLKLALAEIEKVNNEYAEFKKQADDGSKKYAELLKSFEDLDTEHKTYKQKVSEDQEFAKVGLSDEEAREVAGLFYKKLPEKDRPSLSEYISQLREDPDSIPRGLKGYIIDEQESKSKDKKKEGPANVKQAAKQPVNKDLNSMSTSELEAYLKQNLK